MESIPVLQPGETVGPFTIEIPRWAVLRAIALDNTPRWYRWAAKRWIRLIPKQARLEAARQVFGDSP